MYGLIAKMTAKDGQRDALLAILTESTGDMPGCLSYIIASDAGDANAIWVTEVWDDKSAHEASLKLPAVQDAIKKAMPLIADFGPQFHTLPVGGHGLDSKPPVVPDPAFW
jgi:quinol monooxygenase YgiN